MKTWSYTCPHNILHVFTRICCPHRQEEARGQRLAACTVSGASVLQDARAYTESATGKFYSAPLGDTNGVVVTAVDRVC